MNSVNKLKKMANREENDNYKSFTNKSFIVSEN